MSEPCPTPQKESYFSEGRARRGAQYLARVVLRAGRHFDPCYVYRCPCGALHLTRKPAWDGKPHELLYEIAEHLQDFAREKPSADA